MKSNLAFVALAIPLTLPACKPPPTDADLARDMPLPEEDFASAPLPTPPTQKAHWAVSPQNDNRLIYGITGEPALLALECMDRERALPKLQITRLSPADEDAGALLALIGNGHIGRLEVDARELNGQIVWQGEETAAATVWEPFAGPRFTTVTVPGAGMIELNASPWPQELLEACRTAEEFFPSPIEMPKEDVQEEGAEGEPDQPLEEKAE